MIAVCSNRPRPSVQTSGKGHQWWRRDVFHLTNDGRRTLCGRDCGEWISMGEKQADGDDCCCAACSRKAKSA